MARYPITLAAFMALFVVAGAMVLGIKYWGLRDVGYGGLLRYQITKIEQARDIDTVFVGDSALGNAIDAAAFDRIAGTRSLNLALTGLYGYAGSLNMMRRAVARHPVRTVILVHTLDMARRPVAFDGYVFTVSGVTAADLSWSSAGGLLRAFWRRLTDYGAVPETIARLLAGAPPAFTDIEHDYIAQGDPIRVDDAGVAEWPADAVNPRKAMFLDRVAAFCLQKSLRCIYVHGPAYRTLVRRSRAYVAAADALIAATGIPVAGQAPITLAAEELGDALDHVHPAAKRRLTARYAARLRPFLAAAAGSVRP